MLLLHIVRGTPVHIWGLLAGLVALGVSQSRPRTLASARVAVMPVVLTALSLAGVAASFGVSAAALLAWLGGLGLALAAAPRLLPAPTAHWTASRDAVHVAGSWLPLALVVGLFATKYAAGASLAIHPELSHETLFALPVGFAYGLFSGIFAARGWQMWRARTTAPVAAPSAA